MLRSNISKIAGIFLTTSMLFACGGSDGPTTDAAGENQATTASQVNGIVDADTDTLIRKAAELSSMNLGTNLNGIEGMADRSSALNELMKKRVPFVSNENSAAATEENNTNLHSASGYEAQVLDQMLPTLEGGNANHQRSGNTITIGPDERHVCLQWLEADPDSNEVSECEQLLSDLTVRIEVSSEDSGTLSYLFANQTVLQVTYAPTEASYELFLPTVNTVVQRLVSITGDQNTLPDVMQGALKLSAQITNRAPGAESGRLTLAVTQPVSISSASDNYSFSLGTSTLFDVSANAATTNGSINIDINSLAFTAEDLIGAQPTSVTRFNLPAFSLAADIKRSGTEVDLANVGLGRGPLTITVDENQFLRISLATFSATYNDITRNLALYTGLDLELFLHHSRSVFGWFAEDSTTELRVTTTPGTTLQQQNNDSIKVLQGGPVNFNYSYIDAASNIQSDNSFNVGECFDEATGDSGFESVNCD